MSEYVSCPFCHEPDFDLPGLKRHLTGMGMLSGPCEQYMETPFGYPEETKSAK